MLSTKRPSKAKETREKLLDDVTENSKKMRRLNADIEEGLYKKIKIKAAEEETSISDITRQLWIEYLSK